MMYRREPIDGPVVYIDANGVWHRVESGFWPMPQDIELVPDTSPNGDTSEAQ